MKNRRVGSITCGIVLIVFGMLFLLHMVLPMVSYTFIFRFWPLILIFLGIEILVSNRKETLMKYDIGAVLLVILLAVFSMGMGLVELCMKHTAVYMGW